jgi:hypothetical protein
MTWDDEGLQDRFSEDAYGGIMGMLTSDDTDSQLSGLQALGDTLAYGDENLLSSFPIHDFSDLIVQLLQAPIEPLQESASRCVHLLLEAHPQSTRELLSGGALGHIRRILAEFASISVAENLLKACEVISRYAAEPLASEVGIEPMLPYVDFFTVVEQRVILKACSQMTDQAFNPEFPALLPQLLPMVQSTDSHVSRHAVNTCCAIARKVALATFPRETIPLFCDVLTAISDRRQILRVVEVLSKATQLHDIGAVVIECPFSLLWRGSRDGFGAGDFQKLCNGHANTLTVILDTNGNIFGGFTPVEWESYARYKADRSLKSFLSR